MVQTALPIGIGAIIVVANLLGWMRGTGTRKWTPVTATIVNADVERSWWGGRRHHRSPGQSRRFQLLMTYQYTVGDQQYISDDFQVGWLGFTSGPRGSRPYLTDLVREKYQPRSELTVYHHPRKPDRSVVRTGYGGYLPTQLGFGILLVGMGVYGLLRGRMG